MLTEEDIKKTKGILKAIITGDGENFESLLQGVSTEVLNTPVDNSGRTLLHYAATSRNDTFYNILVGKGCYTNVKDINGIDSRQARDKARHARTQWHGVDTHDPNTARKCVMQAVEQSAKGEIYAALALLDLVSNNDANMQVNEAGHTILHLAGIEGSDPAFTEVLLLKGCALNTRDINGNTPLHTIAATVGKNTLGNLDAICDGALIADVNAKNNEGDTPLHIATKRMDHEKIDALLSRLSDISVANNAGKTVFHIVAERWPRRNVLAYIDKVQGAVSPNIEGNRECAEALIFPDQEGISAVQHIIRRNVPDAGKIFERALRIADKVYSSGSPEVRSLFTCPGIKDAKTLLHLVSSNDSKDFNRTARIIVEEACHRFGEEPFTHVDIFGNAPIHAAAQTATPEVFEQVIRSTPESVVNDAALNGKAPIHMIVEDELNSKNSSTKLQALLDNVRNIPSINVLSPVTGKTPVMAAYQKGRNNDVSAMLRCNSIDVDIPSSDGLTIIHSAAKDGKLDILQSAMSARVRKHGSSNFPTHDGIPTPGVYAIREAARGKGKKVLPAVLDLLLPHEPSIENIAIEAIRAGALDILQHIGLPDLLSVNKEVTTPEGVKTTLISEALRSGNYDIVRALVREGANLEASAEPAISSGIKGGCFKGKEALERLDHIRRSGGLVNTPEGTLSPLAAAVQAANERGNLRNGNKIINYLIQSGADIGSTDAQGTPALHLATAAGNGKTALLLLKRGAQATQTDRDGRTALHVAAANGDGKLYKLLASQCPSSCKPIYSHAGSTSLHEALCSERVSERCFLKMLKESQKYLPANDFIDLINSQQIANGDSLLHLASSRGFGQACKVLMKAGAIASVVNIEGKTPADVAAPSLTTRPWFFGTSVAQQLAEQVVVPEGGFPPYVPSEAPGSRTPSLGSLSSFDDVSDISSSSVESASDRSSVSSVSGAALEGIAGLYETAGAEGPVEEAIYEEVKDTGGVEGVESIYATVGAVAVSEEVESEPEYSEAFDSVKPTKRPGSDGSIYSEVYDSKQKTTSSATGVSSGLKEEPIYATVKKGPKEGETSKKEGVSSEKGGGKTISVVKKKAKPAAPIRTSSLLPKEDASSDKGHAEVERGSSFASALQEQKGKLRTTKEGTKESDPGKTSPSPVLSEEFQKEVAAAAEGLQGAVEAQKGDEGAAKAPEHDAGVSSGVSGREGDGSQPEASQSEGHKPVKGGGRGR
uniref:AnkA n=1 Tax=Anaplasma phagocytophilum TaxID=948 RepID=D2KNU9_ANAPH|nr:AnkA [Anaplasma phagocytophilum]